MDLSEYAILSYRLKDPEHDEKILQCTSTYNRTRQIYSTYPPLCCTRSDESKKFHNSSWTGSNNDMIKVELTMMRDEQRFTDLLRDGKSLSKTTKIKRLVNSLQWRHKYQNSDHYSIKMLDERVITVRQVSNGEIIGLGTGVSVWPAAHVLSKYLEKRYGAISLRGLHVCDIGSGTGCTGFVAAALGANVTLTDQAQILPFLEGNKASICLANSQIAPQQIKICQYDWGASAAHLKPPFDIVLVSDCVLPKLYPISPLIEAVAAIMDSHSIALFSYEHRLHPYFDPRQEFRRLATKLGLRVRIIPLSEHDSYYCLGDVEIWEVSFNTLPSEVLEAMGGCTYPGSNTSISQLRSNSCEKANGCERVSESRADSPATTDATAASSTSDVSVFHPFSKKSVEMLSWGSAPVVTARLVDEIVEIRQDLKGVGTGCFLWASSVILSRLILSSEFDEEVMSMFNPMSFCKSRGPRRPTAIDLGAGCGLTTIALLKKGFDVIATDRGVALPLLSSNIEAYLSNKDNRKVNKKNSESSESTSKDNCTVVSKIAQVVEFDWQNSFMSSALCPPWQNSFISSGPCPPSFSKSNGPTELLVALQSLSASNNTPTSSPTETEEDFVHHTIPYPDLLVCSDCVYASASVKPLLQALSRLAGPDTVLLICNEMRTAFDQFISEARQTEDRASCASSYHLTSELLLGNEKNDSDRASTNKFTHDRNEVSASQISSWTFRDVQFEDQEVFGGEGEYSGPLEMRCSNEVSVVHGEVEKEMETDMGMEFRSPLWGSSFSDSHVNRPVRILVGTRGREGGFTEMRKCL